MTADYSDVSQESPREACANLAQIFRDYEAEGRAGNFPEPGWPQYASWASRLERAVQQLDAEQSPRDCVLPDGHEGHCEFLAVPPAEQDTPHPSLPAPEDPHA